MSLPDEFEIEVTHADYDEAVHRLDQLRDKPIPRSCNCILAVAVQRKGFPNAWVQHDGTISDKVPFTIRPNGVIDHAAQDEKDKITARQIVYCFDYPTVERTEFLLENLPVTIKYKVKP